MTWLCAAIQCQYPKIQQHHNPKISAASVSASLNATCVEKHELQLMNGNWAERARTLLVASYITSTLSKQDVHSWFMILNLPITVTHYRPGRQRAADRRLMWCIRSTVMTSASSGNPTHTKHAGLNSFFMKHIFQGGWGPSACEVLWLF